MVLLHQWYRLASGITPGHPLLLLFLSLFLSITYAQSEEGIAEERDKLYGGRLQAF